MKPKIPSIVRHKGSGRSVVFLPGSPRRTIYLRGKPGSAEEQRHYREILADFFAERPVASRRTASSPQRWPTVGELVAAFLLHAERFYVDAGGNKSAGIVNFVHAFRPLLALLRDLPTDQLSIVHLLDVRRLLIEGGKNNRTTINNKLRRCRQCIRWGVERRMVPGSVWHEVSAMKGLPVGRCGVRESKVVKPVPRKMVDAVLPHLPSPLRAAVELQWLCGARPSEILQLTRGRLDMSGKVWVFRPPVHKGSWKGRPREIPLGPECQKILRPLLKVDPEAALISPRDSFEEQKLERRRRRKSPLTPSQRARDARSAAREPPVGEFYGINPYRKALHRACDAAGCERWSPHRLRHACGTRIVLSEGVEAARCALGHVDDRMTRHYAATADAAIAADVMARHG